MAAPFVIMVIRLHVMIMFFKCTDCQVLSTCLLPIYHQECDLNCTTADQSKPISFYKLPDVLNPIAQCLGSNCMVINASLTTMYSIQSTDSTTTTFRINNLSWDEKGNWRCEYNSTQDTTDLGFAKYPDDIEYSGLSNNSDIESGTVMPITMKCLYTEIPTLVTLIYQSTGGTARSIPVTCTDTTSSCANNNFVSKLCRPIIQVETGVVCDGNYSIAIATSVLGNEERKYSVLTGITIKCPTLTTEMSSTRTSQDQTTSSKNPSVDSFPNTEKTETTNMTTTDSDLTSASLHVSSEVTTSIQTESDTGTSQDQTTSSQNPSNAPFHNIQKIETTFMTTTDNDLTSSSLHVSSVVTTPIKTKSGNITDLGVSAIIAIAIAGFIFLSLIIILIICCCQYYRKKSKKRTSEHGEEFQEIHDDVVPKFWPNFNSHRYGRNEINGSTIHLTRGYNLYQGEHNRGYNFRPKHQSDNYNRSGSDRKIITENRKHKQKQKQVQEKISHGFPQSIPDDIMNRHDHDDINGINTYNLHDNNQNMRTYYRGHAVPSPRRSEYLGSFLPHEYIKHNRRSSPYLTYLQEHVPRDLEGLTFYQGYNGAMNKRSRRYY